MWSFWTHFPHPQVAGCRLDWHNIGCSTWLYYYLLDAFHAYLEKILQMTHYFYFSFKKLDIIKVLRKESLQYPYPVLTSRLPCALYVISVTSNLGNLALSSLTHCFLSCINLSFSICTEAAQVPSCYLSTAEIQIGSGIPPRHLTGHNVVGLNPSLSTATSCWVYAVAGLQPSAEMYSYNRRHPRRLDPSAKQGFSDSVLDLGLLNLH